MDVESNGDKWDGARLLNKAEQAISDLNEVLRHSPAPSRAPVRLAGENIQLIVKFIGGYLDDRLGRVLRTSLENDKEFVEAFTRIHDTVNEFTGCLYAINDVGPDHASVARLTELAAAQRDALGDALTAFTAVVEARTRNDHTLADVQRTALLLANDTRSRLTARQLIHEAERAVIVAKQASADTRREAEAAKKAVEVTKNAANEVGANSLGIEYQGYADRENTVANRLRMVVALLAVIVTGCATALIVWADEVSLRTELIRLSVAIPLAVLAGYLARESSRHRAAGQAARELAIALHTIAAYTEPVDDDTKRELHLVLGIRAFGATVGVPASAGDTGRDATTLAGLLREAADRLPPGDGAADKP